MPQGFAGSQAALARRAIYRRSLTRSRTRTHREFTSCKASGESPLEAHSLVKSVTSVNNAGVAGEGSREGYSDIDKKDPNAVAKQMWLSETSEWDHILQTNVRAQYVRAGSTGFRGIHLAKDARPQFTAAAFLPLLAKAKESTKGYASQIINVSSISGVMKTASGGQFAYAVRVCEESCV